MQVLKHIGIVDDIFQKAYTDFRFKCFSKDVEMGFLKNEFHSVEDLFIRGQHFDELCENTMQLSKQLEVTGRTGISNLLINELSKLCMRFKINDKAEELLQLAIRNHQLKDDGLHELARIIDLENLYKYSHNRKKLYPLLKQKKDCCKKIIENYDIHQANFTSIVKIPTSKKSVQVQLAYTYSDLADMLVRRHPNDSIKLYKKAKDIYESLGQTKESRYLEKRIEFITERLQFE